MTKVYQLSKGWQIITGIAVLPMIGLFAWFGTIPFEKANPAIWEICFFISISIGMIIMMILGTIDAFKSKLIIDNERIVKIEPFRRIEYRHNEIKGFSHENNNIWIYPLDVKKKNIKVSTYYGNSEELLGQLFRHYTNIDEEEYKKEEEELVKDLQTNKKLGRNTKEREATFESAKKVSRIVNYAGIGLSFLFLFYTGFYEVQSIILLAFPLIAIFIIWKYKGLIKAVGTKNSPYPSLSSALYMPYAFLLVRLLTDYDLYEYNRLWIILAVLVLPVTWMIKAVLQTTSEEDLNVRNNWERYIVFPFYLLMASFYISVITLSVNCTFDYSTPQRFNTSITNKRVSSGKHTTYYVELNQWGKEKAGYETSVSHSEYDEMEIGDKISVNLKSGLLGIPWIYVER